MITDPNCQVCRHSQRIQIDLAVKTSGQRATAKRFDISRQAIQRHLEKGHSEHQAEPVARTQATPGNPAETTIPTAEDLGVPVPPAGDRAPGAAERAIGAISEYADRKRYIGSLLRTGTFSGVVTLEFLQGCWPDVTMIGLAELVAQAAMEADFFRGTRQARRLVALAKADRIYRKAMRLDDLKVALRTLEFSTKLDCLSAEPDLLSALAASQAWSVAARVLQARFPEAHDAVHVELIAEEARKRQALAPATMETDHAAE